MHSPIIPSQAETLQILRVMGSEPMLMLGEDKDEIGTRWTLSGQEIQPAIARFLMESGFVTVAGQTELGAHTLPLTEKGRQFRDEGLAWWSKLSFVEKLKITLLG